jgi:hypothetical protein
MDRPHPQCRPDARDPAEIQPTKIPKSILKVNRRGLAFGQFWPRPKPSHLRSEGGPSSARSGLMVRCGHAKCGLRIMQFLVKIFDVRFWGRSGHGAKVYFSRGKCGHRAQLFPRFGRQVSMFCENNSLFRWVGNLSLVVWHGHQFESMRWSLVDIPPAVIEVEFIERKLGATDVALQIRFGRRMTTRSDPNTN